VHLYPDTDIRKTMIYWSRVIGIPKSQFIKTQVDWRKDKSGKKKRKLPHGTLHLRINSCGKKEFGRSFHRRIMGWIEVAKEQIQ